MTWWQILLSAAYLAGVLPAAAIWWNALAMHDADSTAFDYGFDAVGAIILAFSWPFCAVIFGAAWLLGHAIKAVVS